MAQVFEDFNGQTLNAIPSGLTSRWVTPSAGTGVVAADAGADASIGSQVFRIEGTGGGFTYERVGFEITEISGSTKDRMAALVEGLTASIEKVPTLILRGGGASAGARSGYMLWLRGGSGNFQIRRVNSGSSSSVASGTLPSAVTALNATTQVEFSALDDGAGGVDVAATVWEIGETKPASPQLTYKDNSPLSVGWAGVGTASADDVTRHYNIGYIGVGTNDDPAPTSSVSAPTITDINTNNEVTPGTTATLTGTNLTNATGLTIGGETQTDFTVVSATGVTFTVVRGGNPYNQDLTATLLSPDGNATITVQQVPESGTFAVAAASPNTTDDASLWSGLVDTSTGDPVTVVDGDQFWVNDPIPGLAIQPDGTITADETGTFTGQFWIASEGVWGSDQTVTFEVPDNTVPVSPGGSQDKGVRLPLRVKMGKTSLRTRL